MADFNDSELFGVFDKSNSPVGAKKKGVAPSLKKRRLQESATDHANNSKRSRKGRPSKVKSPEVVVIKDSSDEDEESNITVKPTEVPTVDKKKSEKDNTDW